MAATHSHWQVTCSSNRVCALSESDDDEGNHCSQKLNNELELQTAEVSSIKDSLSEVLSWSENTKLPVAIRQILRTPFNVPYVLHTNKSPHEVSSKEEQEEDENNMEENVDEASKPAEPVLSAYLR